jgi:hypothetical protein
MTKNRKNTAEKKNLIFGSKIAIYLPLGLHKDVQDTEEAFNPKKRTSSSSKHEISLLFLFFWVIFALPGPDPDSGSGSETLPATLSTGNILQ